VAHFTQFRHNPPPFPGFLVSLCLGGEYEVALTTKTQRHQGDRVVARLVRVNPCPIRLLLFGIMCAVIPVMDRGELLRIGNFVMTAEEEWERQAMLEARSRCSDMFQLNLLYPGGSPRLRVTLRRAHGFTLMPRISTDSIRVNPLNPWESATHRRDTQAAETESPTLSANGTNSRSMGPV